MTLAEIKENDCIDFLGNTFGLLHNQIEEDFDAIDKNGDGLVSKEEGVNAYTTLGLDRSGVDSDSSFGELRLYLYTHCGTAPLEIKVEVDDDKMDDLAKNITDHRFRTYKDTKIIAHGYKVDASDFCSWFVKAYRESGCGVNIICIDWEEYADNEANAYRRAANNAVIVGEKIGEKIVKKVLVDRVKYNPSRIHAIGHSLGAHLVGNIGRKFQDVQDSNDATGVQKIGRITGLDPASLLFDNGGDNEDDRLDQEDARFVDVIHTNSGELSDRCFGISSQIGHVDFYPNGGSHMPGCNDQNPLSFPNLKLISDLMDSSCSHNMAQRYYQDSIKNKNDATNFWSVRCNSYHQFKDLLKDCYGDELLMGEALNISEAIKGRYFLDTNAYDDDKTPYSYSTT